MSLIFVGGIHGVGKTTLCKYLGEIFRVPYYSSGLLLKDYKSENSGNDKTINSIEQNQIRLISVLRKERILCRKDIILDGHFCLFDSSFRVNKLPIFIFQEIKPNLIICLRDDIESIHKRLSERDEIYYEKKYLADLQIAEIQHSEFISKSLDIPLVVIDSNSDKDQLNVVMKNVLGRGRR